MQNLTGDCLWAELHDLRLWGHHGLYPEEVLMGGEYLVHLSVGIPPPPFPATLEDTVDYSRLYAIVKSEFSTPEPLLENLAYRIQTSIQNSFPKLLAIDLSIHKLDVPIEGMEGVAGVRLQKTFSHL